MVIRATKPAAARTPAQLRQAAQRKLAREIKTGTFKPSPLGAKARKTAKEYRAEKTALIKEIREYKNAVYDGSPKFNQRRSDHYVRYTDSVGKKERGIEQLRTIAETLRQITEDKNRDRFFWDWDNIFEDADYVSCLYYH